ncbi:hypothetical protein DFH27DRAFT_82812 [Peziza echinospora]|nr:hypothetical protein DFH27DRAFT_82812 [Peziza echinospora]
MATVALKTYVLEDAQYSQFVLGLVSVSKESPLPPSTEITKVKAASTTAPKPTAETASSAYALFIDSSLNAGGTPPQQTTESLASITVSTQGTPTVSLTNTPADINAQTSAPSATAVGNDGVPQTPPWLYPKSSATVATTSKPISPTTGSVAIEGKNEAAPSRGAIAAVAVGAVIAFLLVLALIVMYCARRRSAKFTDYLHRSRGVPGLGKRLGSERPSMRGAGEEASRRPSMSSFFGLRYPAGGDSGPGRALPPQTAADAQPAAPGPEAAPSPPAPPPAALPAQDGRPRRPERTPSTYLSALSKKHVTWQDQLFQDQSFVTLPQLTRSLSTHTTFTYGSDTGKSLGDAVDDGTPLPDPPARLAPSVKGSHRGPSYSIFPASRRSSASGPSQASTSSGFYNMPAGECSVLTTTTYTDSPVAANLSAPPPLSIFPPLFSYQTTDAGERQEGIGRLASVYGSGLGYLRGSQAASSQYNSVIADSNSDYESVSAYSACYNSEDIIPGLSYKEALSTEKPAPPLGPQAGKRGTQATFTSSVGEGALESMRYLARTLSESFASATANAKSTTLSLLGGSSTLTPAGRQSSIRGSGSVYSSKPSLVSLDESGPELEQPVTGSIMQDCLDGNIRTRSQGPRIASYTSFPPPDFGAPAAGSRNSMQNSSRPTSSIEPARSIESIARCASLTESITSVSSTGSSILYVHGTGMDVEARKERVTRRDKTQNKSTSRCLTKQSENNALRKFGPSQSMKTEIIVAAGFSFPSPWVRGLQPTKHLRCGSALNKEYLYESRQPSPTQDSDRSMSPDHPQHSSRESVPSRHTLPVRMYGNTLGMNAERKIIEESSPTMEALIQELQTGAVDCSSSSIYSSNSSSNGIMCKTSGSFDRSVKSRNSNGSSEYIVDTFTPDSHVFSNSSSSSSSASSINTEFNFPFAPASSPCLSLVPSSSSSVQSTHPYPAPPPPPSPVHGVPSLPLLQFHPLINPAAAYTNNTPPSSSHGAYSDAYKYSPNHHDHNYNQRPNNNPPYPPPPPPPPSTRPRTRGKHTTNRSITLFDTNPLENVYSPTMSMVNFYTSLNAAATATTTTTTTSTTTATTTMSFSSAGNSVVSSPGRKASPKAMSMLVLPQRISAFFGRRNAAAAAGANVAGFSPEQGGGGGGGGAGGFADEAARYTFSGKSMV